jgi:hypothetical protein
VARRQASSIRHRIAEIRHLPGTPRHLRPVMITRGLISRAEAQLLYGLARDVTAGVIVEVGSYRGRSTTALALGSRAGSGVPVYAVEPHDSFQDHEGSPRFGPSDRAAFYRTMLRTRGFRLVHLVNLSSEEVAPGWTRPVGLLWIDGDHSAAAVRRDLAAWRPHLLPGAPVVFDDAVEPSSGPGQVIAEEIAAGRLVAQRSVGKVRVLRFTHASPDAGVPPVSV